MRVSDVFNELRCLLMYVTVLLAISCSSSQELISYSDAFICCVAESNSDNGSIRISIENIDRIEKELLDSDLLTAKSGKGYKKFLIDFFILEKFNSDDLLKRKYFGCDEMYGIEIGIRIKICYDYLELLSDCIESPFELEILKYYIKYKHSEISKLSFGQKIEEIPNRHFESSIVKVIIIYEYCNS